MNVFTNDGVEYDVSLLPQEAQQAFALLADVVQRKQKLETELNVLTTAGKTFNDLVMNQLTKDAIIEINTDEPELPDSEGLGEGPDLDWRID